MQRQGWKRTMADAGVLAAIVIVCATAGRLASNERVEQPDTFRGHDAVEPVDRTRSGLDGAAPIRKRNPIERPVRRAREHDELGDVAPHAVPVVELAVLVQHAAGSALVAPIAMIIVPARHGGHAPRDPGRALIGADNGIDGGLESVCRAATLEPATVDGDIRRLGSGGLQFRNRGRRHGSGPRARGAQDRHQRCVESSGDDRSHPHFSNSIMYSVASFEPMIDSFCTASRFIAGSVSCFAISMSAFALPWMNKAFNTARRTAGSLSVA